MLKAALENGAGFTLVIIAVLFAAVSVYYYFKVIQAMYFKQGNAETLAITSSFKYILITVAALIILLGVFPNMLLQFLYF